ncbi:AbiV family abortive infection protein [Pseudogracilibacillus auburnensis]|nr:AbiV family abortive infection protein [Pseudogracilibacillus auburnensis]MBO1002790.1 AbiV family abortive infection protein [Pseudogracilibacillus auburnensis]
MKPLTFAKLEQAYIKTYENAKELLEEVRILYDNKRYARAYYLAQIAKLPIIFQEATRSHFKESHAWKQFYKRLRSHIDKNSLNIVMSQFPHLDNKEVKRTVQNS